jgi:hypothetical protein
MINEIIEKEIEKLRYEADERCWKWKGDPEELEKLFYFSLQTIAKEVAMRFKIPFIRKDTLANQIINEVSTPPSEED